MLLARLSTSEPSVLNNMEKVMSTAKSEDYVFISRKELPKEHEVKRAIVNLTDAAWDRLNDEDFELYEKVRDGLACLDKILRLVRSA